MHASAQFNRGLRKPSLLKKYPYSEFSGLYFPAFGLNTDQKNSEYGQFLRSAYLPKLLNCYLNLIQNGNGNMHEVIKTSAIYPGRC